MKKLALLIPVILFAGCSSDSDPSDLRSFVETTLNKPRGRIEPIPLFKPYEIFRYSAGAMRSPFELPILENAEIALQELSNVRPDPDRIKEHLEQFPIGALAMVGTIEGKETGLWALVKDGSGSVVRVKEGNYIGQSHGRITLVSEYRINLIEIVPNGLGGWIERPRTLALDGLVGE